MQFETSKKFVATYRAPLLVFALLTTAAGLDYTYRSSSKDYYSQGLTQLHNRKYDEAIADFSRVLRQNPADATSRFGLASAYQAKGWLTEAAKQYEQALKGAQETEAATYLNLGKLYVDQGNHEAALQQFNHLIQIQPENAEAQVLAGLSAEKIGRRDEAKKHFKAALEKNSNLPNVREKLSALGG